ncbi:MAG: hypothetical protein CME70_19270 [Halobacteriovorax sp.]|nr:hypothetical protein [Halobacteriovorax sp.]|tara:strand:+ start:3408 stop:4202 length:795 start_codon:yes stop_codon:yes gene_type:complete
MSSINQLRKFIKETALNEMPVSKSRGWGMDKYEEKYPHLVSFADEIDTVFEDAGLFNVNVQMFDSGYSGISIEFIDEQGSKQKWLVVDQPGKVGLEDQSMGYIFFGPGGQGIQKSNAWIWEQVPYLGRRFGDTNMRDDVRRQTYDAILATIDDMLIDSQDLSPTELGEGSKDMKFSREQLRDLIKEELEQYNRYQLSISQDDYNQFAEDIHMGIGWIDPDYVSDSWHTSFGVRLEPEALAYLISNLEANGLIGTEEQMASELEF